MKLSKAGLDWRPQDVGDASVMGCLLRATKREWNQPKSENCVTVNKARRSGKSKKSSMFVDI